MARVPELYRLQLAGTSDAEFKRMCDTPRTEQERLLGDTYRHLFSMSPSAQPLRAEFVEGTGLVVQAGQHRVMAAKQLGVPYVPVHIAAPNQAQLEHLRTAFEHDIRELTPHMQSVPELHRAHNRHMYPGSQTLARQPPLERHQGPERLEPERELGWRRPERER